MSIGERVLALLKKQGKKQRELAASIGAGESTVSQWKDANRNPSSEMILPICEFLGCSVSYLLTGEESSVSIMSDNDRELFMWLHMLNEETQRDFLGTIRLYVKQHPEDLMEAESSSDPPESQDMRMISSK